MKMASMNSPGAWGSDRGTCVECFCSIWELRRLPSHKPAPSHAALL